MYESTKGDLNKVIGELTARDGKKRSYDEAILELIEVWKKSRSSH